MAGTVRNFTPVLSELARPFAKEANTLLDLREAALARKTPGRCVSCYFKLLAAECRTGRGSQLTPLRQWLEAHIEVVAHDEEAHEIERAPLQIEEGETLEDFAHRLMNRYHEDRAHLPVKVQLNFAYREAIAV